MIDDATIRSLLLSLINKTSVETFSEIPLKAPIDALGIDSIGLSQIVFELEQKFGVEFDDHILNSLIEAETTGDFYEALQSYLVTQSVGSRA